MNVTTQTLPAPISGPAALLVSEIYSRSGLSQAELARRAGLPRSVLNAYLRGHREPGTEALLRIASAAKFDLQLAPRTAPVDAKRASRRLRQVLELAEALPFRRDHTLRYPKLPEARPSQ